MDIHSGLKLRLLRLRASWGQLSGSKKITLALMVLVLLVFPSAYLLSMNGVNLYGRASEPIAYPNPATPIPSEYSLQKSENEINTGIHGPGSPSGDGYGIYVLLKKNGEVVKDQADFEYIWSIDNSLIARLYTFSACIEGIQEPCPLAHANIIASHEGDTNIIVFVRNKQTGNNVISTVFQLHVRSNTTSTPTPRVTIPVPTFTPTPVCHTGVKQLKVRVQCGNSKYRHGSVICWDNSRFEIGSNTACYTSDQIKAWANNKCANRRYCEPVPTLPPFPTVTPTPRIPTPTPTRIPTPSPTKIPTPTPTFTPF